MNFLAEIFFPSFNWVDALDILLVAILLYNLYNLVKGTPAVNILVGILLVYFAWILVRGFEMKLMSSILGKFIDVGVIAIIVVFQQELRRFLLLIGASDLINKSKPFKSLFRISEKMKQEQNESVDYTPLLRACQHMSESKTGALIVLVRNSDLKFYISTGEKVDSVLSQSMIENIFFKNSPLHDGAVIISGDRILAARCVLPVTEKEQFPAHYGMRHRAAVGVSETSDSLSIIVSEQTGDMSVAINGQIKSKLDIDKLRIILQKEMVIKS